MTDIDGDDQLFAASNVDLHNVHSRDRCRGRHCVLHDPSDHHMRTWPLIWRDDRGLMERQCSHGIGHPDPDDAKFQKTMGRSVGVHGCDGCCRVQAP